MTLTGVMHHQEIQGQFIIFKARFLFKGLPSDLLGMSVRRGVQEGALAPSSVVMKYYCTVLFRVF